MIRKTIAILLSIALTGCAVSPSQFAERRETLSDAQVCRALDSAQTSGDNGYVTKTSQELRRRGVLPSQCAELITSDNKKIAAGVIAVAAVVAIAAAATRKGGGGGNSGTGDDWEWDWDQFYDKYGNLVWRCRGVQTGQFARDNNCYSMSKTDLRWPSKSAAF